MSVVKHKSAVLRKRLSDWGRLFLTDRRAAYYGYTWLHSILANRSAIKDALPWYTLPALQWLQAYVKPEMQVFEWGSGGSTLFFAKRARSVITIEHDLNWFKVLHDQVKEYSNLEYRHIPADAANEGDGSYYSASARATFKAYVMAIEAYPDHSFDIVAVDGRARPSCVQHAVPKVRPGGILILDNSERYPEAYDNFDSTWSMFEFYGPVAYERTGFFSRTTIFLRSG